MIIKRILKDWGLEALILSFFVLVIIPYGAGITFDTVSFFEAGDHFWASGKYVHHAADGGMEFAAHRFPLYPLIVSLCRHFDPDLLALQIILFTALIAGFKFLLQDLKSPKYFLLLLLTTPFFINYFAVWTESLYAVLFVWLLIKLRKEKEYQKAVWIIVLVILLCLTRMVGVVVAGSLLLAYMIDKRPLRGLQIFMAGAAVIVVWTMLGSFYLGETARSFGFIKFNGFDLLYFATEFGRWITPFSDYSFIPLIVGCALLLVPFLFGLKAWRNRREKGVLFWFLIIHFYAYIFFVVFSKVMLDASIAYDVRTLFPLMINFTGILILMQTNDALDQNSRSQIRFIFPKLIMLIALLNVLGLWHLRNNGLGYNSKEWQEYLFPEEISRVSSSLVFTNDYVPIYLYGQHIQQAVLMPQKMDLYSLEKYPEYEAGFDLMIFDLEQSVDGKVIWVRNGITGAVYPTYEELKEHPKLKVIYDDWLCVILEPKNYLVESDHIDAE